LLFGQNKVVWRQYKRGGFKLTYDKKEKKVITRTVSHAGLGLCEHCGTLISMEGMPSESIDAAWRCPKCKGILSEKSFGYENAKKKFWVGTDGKWAEKIPEAPPFGEFILGSWRILLNPAY
jgi:hypothetical protein